MRRTVMAAAVAVLAAAPALADGLTTYKGWAESPEAYFLTKSEREAWSAVDTDQKAEAFVNAYRAARGAGFAAAIKSRVEFADKAFPLGKKKGSETLRGWVLVVLGPPTKVDEVKSGAAKEKVDPTSGEIAASSGGENSRAVTNSHSNAGGAGADTLRGMRPTVRKSVTRWSYDAKSVPPALKLPELTVEFIVYPDESREETPDPAKLQKMLEDVVAYWAPRK